MDRIWFKRDMGQTQANGTNVDGYLSRHGWVRPRDSLVKWSNLEHKEEIHSKVLTHCKTTWKCYNCLTAKCANEAPQISTVKFAAATFLHLLHGTKRKMTGTDFELVTRLGGRWYCANIPTRRTSYTKQSDLLPETAGNNIPYSQYLSRPSTREIKTPESQPADINRDQYSARVSSSTKLRELFFQKTTTVADHTGSLG